MTAAASSQAAAHRGSTTLASRAVVAGTAAVAVIILCLHFLKRELDPSWRFISEYAIGRHGWLMQGAFVLWAVTCVALSMALAPEIRSRAGRIGRVMLLVVAVALVFAGLFPQDPVTATPDQTTSSGAIHAIASMIGIPGIPVAAMLISSSLWKSNDAWRSERRAIMCAAHATWLSLVLMVAYLAWAVPRAGGFNADVWAGWLNRLVVATYLAWQLVVSWRLLARALGRAGSERQ